MDSMAMEIVTACDSPMMFGIIAMELSFMNERWTLGGIQYVVVEK
jgi:hypothetical protein